MKEFLKENNIKVKEKSGMRKDRFSSLEYNWWVCTQLEQEYNRKIAQPIFNQTVFLSRPTKSYK